MEIKYLTVLRDNPSQYSDGRLANESLGYDSINNQPPTEEQIMSAIEELEITYNQGSPFPIALRELLFIGGKYNWAMGGHFPDAHDYIANGLEEDGLVLTRPFFVLEYWGGDFHFIYLDEGEEDPRIYTPATPDQEGNGSTPLEVEEHSMTVSALINHRAVWKLRRRDAGEQ